MAMPGGGGYGAALEREPARVREDVLDGFVTREGAQRDYAVVLDDELNVDVDATGKARSSAAS